MVALSATHAIPSGPDLGDTAGRVQKVHHHRNAPGGMSNMFSFPCNVRPNKINNTKLADCYGPMNESPTGAAVPPGTEVMTQSPAGAANPVGGPTP